MNHEATPVAPQQAWPISQNVGSGDAVRLRRGVRWLWIAFAVNGALSALLVVLGIVLVSRVFAAPPASPAAAAPVTAPSPPLASAPPVYSPERVAADKHGLCMVYDHSVRGLAQEMQQVDGVNRDIGLSRASLSYVVVSKALEDYPAAPPELRSVVEKYATGLRDIPVTFGEDGKKVRSDVDQIESQYADMCKGEKDW